MMVMSPSVPLCLSGFVILGLVVGVLLEAAPAAAQGGPEYGSDPGVGREAAGPATPDPATPDPGSLVSRTPDPRTPNPASFDPTTPDRHSSGPSSPDHGNPDPSSPDHGNPDPSSPDHGNPDPSSPDHGNPDPSSPDHGNPDPSSPDHGNPDPSSPDPSSPDLVSPDTWTPDSSSPNHRTSDLRTPDFGSPDQSTPEPGSSDHRTPDPSTLDTESPEPGRFDTRGTPDPEKPDHVTEKSLTAAVPYCICDLIDGSCELDCCCDTDCSPMDINAFSSCLPGSQPVVSQVCIEESVIFTSNSPFQTVINEGDMGTLFCVIVNNPKTNYFLTPQSISRERLPLLVSQFGRGSFVVPSEQQNGSWISAVSRDVYKVGDRIFTFFSDASAIGFLMLPTALTGGECTDRNPAGFLQDRSSRCTRRVGNLNATCIFLTALNAETYFKNFYLLPSPNLTNPGTMVNLGNEMPSSPSVSDNLCHDVVSELQLFPISLPVKWDVFPHQRHFLNRSCCSCVTAWEADICCSFQVTYNIEYGHDGITHASVSFDLNDIPLSETSIQQSFHIAFRSDLTNGTGESRSGNPGYLKGKPVLAFTGGVATGLSVLRSTGDGSCSQLIRSPVLFTHQMRTSCLYSFDPDLTCSQHQTQINLLLLGNNPPDSLGILGNASGKNPESLTRIVNLTPMAPDLICQVSCVLSLALDIQILWASLGPLANPQAAVLGARFQYQQQEVQCSTRRASLKTSVTFIETTRYPPAPRDQPTIEQKLPFDFFNPFKVISSGTGVAAGSILGTVCTVIVTSLLGQR
ncbi:tectonic-3-like isoform X2 [Mustelus asterias]